MAGFAGGRLQTAARATGVMQAAFEQAVRYAWERKVFGQPIANFQLTERKLARMLATITAPPLGPWWAARNFSTKA
ncbi:MAG: acyl-CoA dehydrogenase family protein [Burkholderiaceae bacterium]